MSKLNESARAAFQIGNYKLAATNWIMGHALPDDEEELKAIYVQAEMANRVSPDSDLCAILGLIALDFNEVFTSDRREALMQCVEWSKLGLSINPDDYNCNRHAGSARYWLNEWDEAAKFYQKAISLSPSPLLQIRLFAIANHHLSVPDFSKLEIDEHIGNAMEAYNAGVELKNLLNQYPQMLLKERQRLQLLKMRCYETAYQQYHQTLAGENGDPLNDDPHTFAMCCNNLALEKRMEGKFDAAITILTEGMEHSYFMYILQNRFGAYIEGEYLEKAVSDGESLVRDFIDEMDISTFFNILDNLINCLMRLKSYQEALKWIKVGQESYYALDPSGGVASSDEAVKFFTNTFIQSAKANEALGIEIHTETAALEIDAVLDAMPDNPTILISRANHFIDEANYDKALECLQYAVHFASQQGQIRSAQVALYNMGYIHAAKLRNELAGLENFEQSMALGNRDFWCLYWAVHCCYHLHENEKTIDYARIALEALQGQDGVKSDVIAEIYEHLGTAQFDMDQIVHAEQNLRISLQYHHSKAAEDNLLAATAEVKRSHASGLFKKLFGQ